MCTSGIISVMMLHWKDFVCLNMSGRLGSCSLVVVISQNYP